MSRQRPPPDPRKAIACDRCSTLRQDLSPDAQRQALQYGLRSRYPRITRSVWLRKFQLPISHTNRALVLRLPIGVAPSGPFVHKVRKEVEFG